VTSATEPPNRLPWPPLILAATLAAGLAMNAGAPLAVGVPPVAGLIVVAAAVVLDLWAIATLRAARTTVLPHRAATRLVRAGPFALSRNPIYVGNTLLLIGLGVLLGNAWLLLGAIIAAVLMHRLAVLPEEHHLSAAFGAEWTDYAASTPRWIGLRRDRPPSA
jgi:protein-S-isoprenylcysteine O-methyltransferase Ste14